MATANDVIEEAIRLVLGGTNEEMNKLAAPVGSGATTLTFTYDLGAIGPGSIVTIGLESYRVWTVNSGAKTAVVEPAYQGTATTAHASGSLVSVNPRISRFSAFKALNDELSDLSSPLNGLYRMKSVQFTQTVADQFDLAGASDLISVYDVVQEGVSAFNDWSRLPWQTAQSQDPTDFPSGTSLRLLGGAVGRPVRVLYRAGFSRLTNLTDSLENVAGIPVQMHDILPLGILMRLGPMKEIARNFTETQPGRRAEEVPSGAIINSFRAVTAQRTQRIQAEAARLMRLYPERRPAT